MIMLSTKTSPEISKGSLPNAPRELAGTLRQLCPQERRCTSASEMDHPCNMLLAHQNLRVGSWVLQVLLPTRTDAAELGLRVEQCLGAGCTGQQNTGEGPPYIELAASQAFCRSADAVLRLPAIQRKAGVRQVSFCAVLMLGRLFSSACALQR